MNDWLQRNKTWLLAVIGLAVVALIVAAALRYRRPATMAIEPPPPTATPQPTATPGPINVYVSGAVVNPAVYTLPPGTDVQTAIAEAGGATDDADLSVINLARVLTDQQQVYVPVVGEAEPPEEGDDSAGVSGGLININTATAEELDTLPGIGPATAEAIISYREIYGPFHTIGDLAGVPGIGPATMADIQDLITVE